MSLIKEKEKMMKTTEEKREALEELIEGLEKAGIEVGPAVEYVAFPICESCCGTGEQELQDEEEAPEIGICDLCEGTGIEGVE